MLRSSNINLNRPESRMRHLKYAVATIIFFNYSECMDADLTALEQKLLQLIARYNELRDENARLRLDLGAMESDTALLKANMAKASERIEALMQTLP